MSSTWPKEKYHSEKWHMIKMWKHNQDFCNELVFSPFPSLKVFSNTFRNKSNIVELLYVKLLAVRAPPTPSGDYSRSQSFQLQDFRAEMYLQGPDQWKQLPEKRKR